MLDRLVMRTLSSVLAAVFGSLGVFFTYLSFVAPGLGVQAVLFLAIAMALLWSVERFSSGPGRPPPGWG